MSIAKLCTVKDCTKKFYAKELCNKHYSRVLRNGSVETMNNQDGLSYHALRRTYSSMIDRCESPSSTSYAYYGGRGIAVCSRWRSSFKNFLHDVGERPDGMTLDRIDPNGDYEPGNVRWADNVTQGRNRRTDKRNTTGRSGVCYSKAHERWMAYISVYKKQRILGYFKTKEGAIKSREEAENKYW